MFKGPFERSKGKEGGLQGTCVFMDEQRSGKTGCCPGSSQWSEVR